ncbi:hypothetical protein Nepgr_027435 [Nepenthes gracilis]|uniref:Reverse transcriptase domain-containing protein n=1 Tax=Nepenthes gracilis TaxID=150966 RepID=A0AAD3TBR0_NEPGR|nr:hypothetical protein Nepgr_027435 [Nepenthes gracilis]
MDAYSGYNQIKMCPEDEEHTSFMTDQGTYCYKVMPFGLKNAGATYQRLVNKMFEDQIGRNVEVYVDDLLVKSTVSRSHIEDLTETFRALRAHGMKLNPSKCTFGVTSGKFLGYIVSQRGIEANPEKIQAILNMQSPRTVRDVQRLTGRVAALSRFLAKSAERHLPFFRALRGPKTQGFRWSNECEEALQGLKVYLANPPLLASPEPGEELYLYLSVTGQALSSVLVKERQGNQQPVYYVSKILADSETRYPHARKSLLPGGILCPGS